MFFTHLFGDPEYTLQLYRALHPEDTTSTEADLEIVTLDNQLLSQPYNDLGFTVGGKLLILVEAQTTWTINMVVRGLLYMAETIHRHLVDTKQDLYGAEKVTFPEPEFYVIYTGNQQEKPEWLTLSGDFFGGRKTAIDVRVKMIYDGRQGDIIHQYITFCHVCDAQFRLYGRTREAVLEAIRICKNQDVLTRYLASRDKEVLSIMMTLFDHEEAFKAFLYQKEKKARADALLSLVKDGLLPASEACKRLNMTESELKQKLSQDLP